ncbi:MAG: hypothetical protein ABJO09_00925 [Hyphomicrobiales bacterium]
MSIKYFRSDAGNYLGAYGEGVDVPDGAIECDAPPHALCKWNGSGWDEYVPPVALDPNDVNEFASIAEATEATPKKRLFVVSKGDDAGVYLNRPSGVLKIADLT